MDLESYDSWLHIRDPAKAEWWYHGSCRCCAGGCSLLLLFDWQEGYALVGISLSLLGSWQRLVRAGRSPTGRAQVKEPLAREGHRGFTTLDFQGWKASKPILLAVFHNCKLGKKKKMPQKVLFDSGILIRFKPIFQKTETKEGG